MNNWIKWHVKDRVGTLVILGWALAFLFLALS